MTTVGGSSFTNAAPISAGQTSAATPGINYPAGASRPFNPAWWKITPTEDGDYKFDTHLTTGGGGAPDTVMTAHQGSEGNEVHYSDDNGDSPGGYTSEFVLTLTAGTTTHIKVGTYGGASDEEYRLRVTKIVPFEPVGTQGADAHARATEITTLPFFSDPTPSDQMKDVYEYLGEKNAWWKIAATQTGYLSVDALTSPLLDFTGPYDTYPGIQVAVHADTGTGTPDLFVGRESNWYDEARGVYVTRGQLFFKATAGVTYYVSLSLNGADEAQYRLRVSDYGDSSAWVQGPDQKVAVFTRNEYSNTRNIQAAGPGQYSSLTQTNAYYQALSTTTGWQGQNGVQRSFGGPYPGDDPNAIQYTWENSRKVGSGTGYWWSPNNQTAWNGGPGSKPDLTGGVWGSDQTLTDHPVGYHFHTDTAHTYQGVYWRVWHLGQSVNLGEVTRLCGANGGSQTYVQTTLDAMGNPDAYDLEWEASQGTLLELEVAPDEDQGGGSNKTFGGSNLPVRWYARTFERRPAGGWGISKDGWSDVAGKWRTTTAGPSGWTDASTFLTSYTGGLAPWVKISDALLNQAKAVEAAETDSNMKAGLLLHCAPDGFDSDGKPGTMGAAGLNRDDYWLRRYQACAVRPTIRPARYKVIAYPGIPDAPPIEPPAESEISGAPLGNRRAFT
jgi:hypothetical protein